MPPFLPWLVFAFSALALALSVLYCRRARRHALAASVSAAGAAASENLAMLSAAAAESSRRIAGAVARNAARHRAHDHTAETAQPVSEDIRVVGGGL
ncbi:hypothetical protein ACIHFD_49640 [Nonomuraea sp. NPDC051941]|uniref:hypothetical protein n=1 Tax=Nonomuraea sp. NPDC051941 TaxID=3364373 RepID=UPI0037C8B00D